MDSNNVNTSTRVLIFMGALVWCIGCTAYYLYFSFCLYIRRSRFTDKTKPQMIPSLQVLTQIQVLA